MASSRQPPLRVAWISYFPVEWLPDLPEPLANLPRGHPAPWQRVLLELLQGEADVNFHIIDIRRHYPRHCRFERNGVVFDCLKGPGGWRRPSLYWLDTLLIRRCLRASQPDLVHAWGVEHGSGVVAPRLGRPFLTTIQGILGWYLEHIQPTLFQRLGALLERRALARSRTATAESRFSTGYIRQHFPHLEVRHIEVVPDPLFHQVERRPETAPPRFLFVGDLDHRKGGDLFVRALDTLPFEFTAVVIGNTDEFLARERRLQCSARTWSRVLLKQNLRPDEVAQELARAMLMICPTRADTGPVAVKEAAVAGVPVVGSAVGGIPDYVAPGKNGLLFPSGDLEGCAAAIREACSHPLFSQGRVEGAALAELRDRLSPKRMAAAFLALYRELGSRAAGRS